MSTMKLAALTAAALLALLLPGSGQGGSAYAQSSGSIAGWVFYDLNGNGQHEPHEPGLEGWYLTLAKVTDADSNVPPEFVKTAWDGSYRFSDVEAADYLVFIGPMPTPGPQPAPGSDLNIRVTLETGQSLEGVNFRIALPEATPAPASGGAIEGYVFIDADGDGAMGVDEYGLTGVSLTLLDQDTWAETGIDGRYSFGALLPGMYRVRLNLTDAPEGIWLATSPVLDPLIGISREVVLAAGETVSGVSFAVRRLEGTGIIAGTVFEDTNRNGVRDSGEEGVEPARVALEGVDFLIRGPSRADVNPDGRYQFTGLPVGSYRVFGIAPEELGLSVQTDGPDGPITLAEGETLDQVDFGYARLRPGSISGRFIDDADGDGQLEEGEPGLGGWDLCLARGSSDVIYCEIHTESDGTYTVEDLAPGEYHLRPQSPAEREGAGPSDWVPTAPDSYWRTVTLEEGQEATGVDFGIHTGSSSAPEPSPPVSSSASAIESWQIAVVAVGSAATLGGVLGAALIARRRRARSG